MIFVVFYFLSFLGALNATQEERSNQDYDGDSVATVDIGNNFFVQKSVVDDIKSDYRHQPGIFLRKLMYKTGLFTLQEVADCSVTGKRYIDGKQRPQLDSARFLACKSE
jgi:hypothetical protein